MDYDKDHMMEFTGLNSDELAELQKLMHGYHPADFAPETARAPSSPPNRPGVTGMANMPSAASPASMPGMMNMPNAANPADRPGIMNMPDTVNPTERPGMMNMPGTLNPANMPGMMNMPNMANPANMPGMANVPANAAPITPMRAGSDAPSDRTDDDMQHFMEQGYLIGPNCFSRESQSYAGRLMEYINDEYKDHLTYTALVRRAPTAAARTIFRNLAADELRHARQFASAYFLITGKRYFPDRRTVATPSMPPYSQALRDRYIAESRDAVKYRQFAREATDRCLRRMAIETSNDERNHAQQILTLIQQQY